LLVTGVLAGSVAMRSDLLDTARPDEPFLAEAEARLAAHLRALLGGPEAPPPEPADPGAAATGTLVPGVSQPFEPGSELPGTPSPAPRPRAPDPIFASSGTVTLAAENVSVVRGDEENAVLAHGGVVVHYGDPRSGDDLQISAERAVVFLDPGPLREMARHAARAVRGIYLEGDVVATDGSYTLRGPHMYYDVRANRAHVADAVFWTYDQARQLPIYVRARALEQQATDRFRASDARLATSAFFSPHFSVGASTITVSRLPEGGLANRPQTLVDARHITLRAGSIPFFYWPRFRGDVENTPLRALSFSNSSRTGGAVQTAWDVFGLLGREGPDWLSARLLIDHYFERGPALGTEADWRTEDSWGTSFVYGIFGDRGTDHLTSGAEVERDGETRGLALAEHRWKLDDDWSLTFEGAHISDENFIDAFFEPMAESRREFTTAANLKHTDDNALFYLLAKGDLNDFAANEYLLQSQAYSVDKLPEVGYVRLADDLLSGSWPGLLNYTSEFRASRMALNMTEPTARALGFDTEARSRAALGILPDQSPERLFKSAGLEEESVHRFDTRHELAMAADFGPMRVAPFATGRFTAYDTRFEDFAPDQDESMRTWGAIGARASTTLTRVDDDVSSRLLDLNRIRHIVEPSLTVWTGDGTISADELPVYDQRVEALAEGSALKLALDQTWQTKRVGVGQSHSVDVLTLRTELVGAGGQSEQAPPIQRFFDFRPEYSHLGDHGLVEAAWQATDALGVTYLTIYDLEINQPAYTVTGLSLQHDPDLSTFAELRYINPRDITLLNLGANYRLTRKYSVHASFAYDTDLGEFQGVGGTVRRKFPDLTLAVALRYDHIAQETSFGLIFEPAILGGERVDLQRLNQRR
ncbi:MAG TPA: hypothetical protein VD963_02405, partial [Phycisphaerales bacterium]|nr:hypothetical protein [Phycisphaerales bacterium]